MTENENLDSDEQLDNADNIEIVDAEEDEVAPPEDYATFEMDEKADTLTPIEEETPSDLEEEVAEQKPEKKKKHSTLKSEFNKVQRERYAALNEIENLRKENERLQSLAQQNAQSAMYNHDQAIGMKLEQAKAAKAAAYDSADTEGLIKADELFAEAMSLKAESDRWKAEQKYIQSQQQQRQQPQAQDEQQQQYQQDTADDVEINEEAENWLANNTWFDAKSPDFNQSLAQLAHNYSLALEQEYIIRGEQDKIFTQDYFDDIDRYIGERYFDDGGEPEQQRSAPRPAVRRPPANNQQQSSRMNLNMKQVRQNVAPVGKTVKQAAPANPNRVVLTAREREFAKSMNLKPEEYAKHKLQINKSGRYGYEKNGR